MRERDGQKKDSLAAQVGSGSRRSTKEAIILVSAFTILLLVIMGIIKSYEQSDDASKRQQEIQPSLRIPTAMSVPDLVQVRTLPSVEESAQWQSEVQWLIDHPQELRSHLNGFTQRCFSWWQQQLLVDEQQPPQPQLFPVADITSATIDFGTTILTSGLVVGVVDAPVAGGDTWQWLLLEMPHKQYVLLIVPASETDYTIGEDVRILGRYLSTCALPGGASGERIAVIGVRHLSQVHEQQAIVNYGMDGMVQNINTVTAEEERVLWEEINDTAPILELRPYYYMLAKVLMKDSYDEHIYEDAQDANAMSLDLYARPSAYRDQIFTVEGKVLECFVDEAVAADAPYGITTVTRIIMWLHVYGDYQEHDITGKVSHSWRLIAHSYELALIGKHPLPEKGQRIRATGRFLKIHGMPMEKSMNREAVFGSAQSNNYYSKMFIVRDYEVIHPAEEDLTLTAIIASIAGSFILCALYLFLKDARKGMRRQEEQHHKRIARRGKRINAVFKDSAGSDKASGERSAAESSATTIDDGCE